MAKNDDEYVSGGGITDMSTWDKAAIVIAAMFGVCTAVIVLKASLSAAPVRVIQATPSSQAAPKAVAPPATPGEVEAFIVPSKPKVPKAPAAPAKKN